MKKNPARREVESAGKVKDGGGLKCCKCSQAEPEKMTKGWEQEKLPKGKNTREICYLVPSKEVF